MSSSWLPGSTHSLARKCSLHLLLASSVPLTRTFLARLFKMGLRSREGQDIKEIWQDRIRTYLGMTFSGFPNTFMVYSPQGKLSVCSFSGDC
jgi:cation diffusion facilitator CzcD-associated flavoprotein CzcO